MIKDDILDQKLRWASLGTRPSAKYSRQSESQIEEGANRRCVKKWKLALCASGDREDLPEQAPIVSSLGGESGSYPLMSEGCLACNSAVPGCSGHGDSAMGPHSSGEYPEGEMWKDRRSEKECGYDVY